MDPPKVTVTWPGGVADAVARRSADEHVRQAWAIADARPTRDPALPAGPAAPLARGGRHPIAPAGPTSGARRIGESALPPWTLDPADASREIAVVALTVVAFGVMLDGPLSWLVAALLGGGVLLAARSATPGSGPPLGSVGRSAIARRAADRLSGLESGLIPGVMAAALVLAIRLVAVDWILVVVVAIAGLLLAWTIQQEQRLAASAAPEDERWRVAMAALAAGFIGFSGVAAMVAGGLAEPIFAATGAGGGSAGGAGSTAGSGLPMGEPDLLLLAAGDALIAGLLGFRLVCLGPATRWEATLSAASYAGVVALGAGLLRAMAIPQLVGPALLTLLFYLWDAFHATTPSIRRDARWRWQMGLLLVLSAVVVAWNLQLRG